MFSWAATHQLKPLISITANKMFFIKMFIPIFTKNKPAQIGKRQID
jgi:hypothetical protein